MQLPVRPLSEGRELFRRTRCNNPANDHSNKKSIFEILLPGRSPTLQLANANTLDSAHVGVKFL